MHLKQGNTDEAFEYFGKAMAYDNSYSNALLGIASIYQDKGEYKSALIKYNLSLATNPNSPLVWNNLGLCFFASGKYMAAVCCLKRAIYLDPFEWIIAYNLGLVYLHTNQYASAFHYMNSASNLKTDLAVIFMYLGIILSQLNDISNSISYYDKAIELEPNYLTYFNYTVSLINNDMLANAKEKYQSFVQAFKEDGSEVKEFENEIKALLPSVKKALKNN